MPRASRSRAAARTLAASGILAALLALPFGAVMLASPSVSPFAEHAALASAQEPMPDAAAQVSDLDAPVAFAGE